MNFTAKEIANILGGTIKGDPNIKIDSVAKIEEGSTGNLCFLANEKYTNHIYTTNASIIIVNNSFHLDQKINATLIQVDDAYSSFSKLLEIYNNMKFNRLGVSNKAEIHQKTSIGNNVYIGPFTSIEKGVNIGNNVKIYSNCYIGENVTIIFFCSCMKNIIIFI